MITSKEALDLFIRELTAAYDEGTLHQCESGIVSIPAPQPALQPMSANPERVPELSSPSSESGVDRGHSTRLFTEEIANRYDRVTSCLEPARHPTVPIHTLEIKLPDEGD
jgi:hypothetical protein